MLNATKILTLLNDNLLDDIRKLCEKEIEEQSLKERKGSTFPQRNKAVKKLLKDTKYPVKTEEINGEKMQCFTNGYVAFAMRENNYFEGLPKENGSCNYNRIFNDGLSREEVEIDIAEIKKFATLCKTEKRIPNYEINKSLYNATLILEAYKILGGDIKFYQAEKSLKPSMLESENGHAFIMPMRKKNRCV